ncbi:hypothetical protein [Helicobacter apodemus]|uniref:Uncharacterized protein n=1 Tax=Helicobacter apodemus TaxID=135569 RepID=A0A2U8FDI8_9HELI|nr:hypothetical protein [Helicobacter apodemus]AWI34311.1 hypothetical protein CDV25_05715 [Helicobacter apodemus]
MDFIELELIYVHLLLSLLLFLPPLINLYALLFKTSHTQKLKFLALMAPAYYTFLSASLFSGLVSWAMLRFTIIPEVFIMLILWLLIFILEIKRHKKQKLIQVESNPNIRLLFFQWALRKYLFDICAFIGLFLLIL